MAKRVSMIHVRGGFSEAHGMGSCNTQMQIDDLDDRTRNILFNVISKSLDEQFRFYDVVRKRIQTPQEDHFCRNVLTLVFEKKLEPDGYYSVDSIMPYIEKVFDNAVYNELFDLIETICMYRYDDNEQYKLSELYKILNYIFEQEYVGYRFVDGKITPITDENEIKSIEDACNNEFEGTRTHIKKAVGFIADREHKDYQNCIKESISAVESICSIVAEQKKSLLGDALKNLKKKGIKIHPQLESAFLKLYDYTNSEKGIRHANGMFESDVTFEEAKFMLVSCSAFVNYLTANYGKVGGEHA